MLEREMKKLLGLVLVTVLAAGCATKIEQARNNIQRMWRIDKVFENGQEVTSSYTATRANYRIYFDGDNTFEEVYQQFAGGENVTVTGSWEFSDNASLLTLTSANQSRIYAIDKLDEDELNITDRSSNNERRIEFVPN